jgi:hypothetical protein
MATSSERSRDVPLCVQCDRQFASIRGLDIHRNRAHKVSDNFVIDFLNLPLDQQEAVLRAVTDGKQIAQDDVIPKMLAIISSPQSRAENTTLRSALAQITGVEYRYLISEEP